MPERLTDQGRQALMRRIGSRDTRPELVVRRMVHAAGYRYVLHDKRLPGRPDLVFPSRKKVIFVHGCFWHRHTCGRGYRPVKNADFWAAKLEANAIRDRRQIEALIALGWGVLIVWECATRRASLPALESSLTAFLEDAGEPAMIETASAPDAVLPGSG